MKREDGENEDLSGLGVGVGTICQDGEYKREEAQFCFVFFFVWLVG